MTHWFGIGTVAALVLMPLAAACHENGCDQPPFYECGTYNRESRTFCYYIIEGRYVPALEDNVVNVTFFPWSATPLTPDPHLPEQQLAYVWLTPIEASLAAPATTPLEEPVYRETNHVPGLQAHPFKCGTWVWFAEFPPGCWFGPFQVTDKPADLTLAESALQTPLQIVEGRVADLAAAAEDPESFAVGMAASLERHWQSFCHMARDETSWYDIPSQLPWGMLCP